MSGGSGSGRGFAGFVSAAGVLPVGQSGAGMIFVGAGSIFVGICGVVLAGGLKVGEAASCEIIAEKIQAHMFIGSVLPVVAVGEN